MSATKGKKKNKPFQNKQITALRQHIFSDDALLERLEAGRLDSPLLQGFYVVFISICDAKSRALVMKGTGNTLDEAWRNAEHKANLLTKNNSLKIAWAKADIVNSAEEIATTELNKELVENNYKNFFRKGIALSPTFDIAFLEAELNGNRMLNYYSEEQISKKEIDYDSAVLDLTRINYYLKTYYNCKEITSIPDRILTFTTTGLFCDKDLALHRLHDKGFDCGRRATAIIDGEAVEPVMLSASKYLYSLIKPDGEFIYGYYPIFHKEIDNYNILRHAGSIWSLINLYRITKDDELVPKLNAAIDYLTEGYIICKNEDTAYVFEKKTDEIKLGGNGLSIIMLTEYMDVFETDKYIGLVRKLANGILEMEDMSSGKYFHVLNYPDFSSKEEFRTIYYDGEATFALSRAYTYTNDEKYLHGAKMAVENFIAEDYTKYRDHWVAYALNEITKYIPEPRFFEFAMQNAGKNLKTIYHRARSTQTNLELLTITWQTFKRIQELEISTPYIDEFDVEFFAKTIYQRARHLLNGYFYPEFAMYMKRPSKVAGSFFVREDNFRVRIDDIQHYIGGYYFYSKYFNEILPYLSKEFLGEYADC